MTIENLPKGALPDEQDPRDFKLETMGAIPPIDFSQEFRLPEPPDSDQAQADCCVGEAWSYYHWQLTGKTYSVKSLFAYIAQFYGAYIRDGGLRIVKHGQETFEETPDPNPKTPRNMRDKTGLNPDDALDDREYDSFVVPESSMIQGVAWGVKNYKGCVFGVTGSNEGWADMANPRPPASGENTWGHALYAMGYHLHNGLKCIIAKSSWCNSVREHHIKENYFVSGNTFNGWTLIPRKPMSNVKLVKNGNEYAFYVPATGEAALIDKALNFGYPLPTKNDGKEVDWPNVRPDYTL
jgi:hypothetical protein